MDELPEVSVVLDCRLESLNLLNDRLEEFRQFSSQRKEFRAQGYPLKMKIEGNNYVGNYTRKLSKEE